MVHCMQSLITSTTVPRGYHAQLQIRYTIIMADEMQSDVGVKMMLITRLCVSTCPLLSQLFYLSVTWVYVEEFLHLLDLPLANLQ